MRVLISADGRMPVDLSEDTNLIASYDDVPAFVTEYDRQFHELEGKPEQRTPFFTLTLDQLKDFKYHQLKDISAMFESDRKNPAVTFVSSLGFTVDGDARSIDNISGLVNAGLDNVAFRDHDNQSHRLTHDDLVILLREAQANIQFLYEQKWELKQKIMALATREDVLKFDISFGMTDFTKTAADAG